jgi:hypothetical protein
VSGRTINIYAYHLGLVSIDHQKIEVTNLYIASFVCNSIATAELLYISISSSSTLSRQVGKLDLAAQS